MVSYIYRADNFPRTFRAEDKLYIDESPELKQGELYLLRQGDFLTVKRIYPQESGYLLLDEKNPPTEAAALDVVGQVVGYESMFAAGGL